MQCLPVTKCGHPNVESVKPTTSSDRLCACDKLMCNRMVQSAYEARMCRPPTGDEMASGVDDCCHGQLESQLHNNLQSTQAFIDRHTCPGCASSSCECLQGFQQDSKDGILSCTACDGKTGFAEGDGATECEAVTACGRGEGELIPPTSSSDRVCRACPAGTLDEDGNGATDCVAGAKGTYIPEGSYGEMDNFLCPPGSADTDSNPATLCQKCMVGIDYQDKPGQLSCSAVTACKAGEEEVSAMTEIRNRICQPCSPGRFKADAGQGAKCQVGHDCPAGMEELSPPTATSDRKCIACKDGAFKDKVGQDTLCLPVTVCRAGEEEVIPPTAISDRQCHPCELGETFKAAPGQNSTCVRAKVCGRDQYLVKAATRSSDTICQELTTCGKAEFESTPETLTTDRKCTPCTSCPSGRFQIQACTATSDAQCEGCTPCPSGHYQAISCTPSADTICLECEACSKAEYVSAECSATAQTVCEPLTVCGRDEFLTAPANTHSDRKCQALTVCTDGEYESVKPSDTSDRACAAYTVCRPGEQETKAPGLQSDRVCQQCPAGSTDHDSDPSSLSGCRFCGPGMYSPPGSIGDCSLFACEAGYADEDNNGATPCSKCVVGISYAPTRGSKRCLPVTDCSMGSEEVAGPTPFANRLCNSCLAGFTYKAKADNSVCLRITECNSTEFQVGPDPTAATDRVCNTATVCDDSQYISSRLAPRSDRVCNALTVCKDVVEYEAMPPSATSDRVCQPVSSCDAVLEFEEDQPTATSDRMCAAITICSSTEYEVKSPTRTSDRLCSPLHPIRLYFDANFDTVINFTIPNATTPMAGFEPFVSKFYAAVGVAGLDNASFVNLRIKKGSIILDVWSKLEEVRYKL